MIPDRKDIVRADCPTCNGNGYISDRDGEHPCDRCGGVGMLEKSMPYRAEGYTLEDAGRIFGIQNPTNRLLPGDPALDRSGPRNDE